MTNLRQFRSLTFGLTAGALALAIVFVLTVVASQAAQAQTYQVLYNFTGGADGANPNAGVTMDKAGNLYGTTFYGGTGYGAAYQLKHKGSGWTLNTLHTFTGGSDGAYPSARAIFGPDGALYSTTFNGGGGAGYGVVSKLRPAASACKTALCPWTESVLYQFAGPPDGASPLYGDLIFDQAGNIYGTTYYGGAGTGTVYQLTPSGSGWTEIVLYRFKLGLMDGANPSNGMVFDNAGNLYSTTQGGGNQDYGAVFQLTPSGSGWTEKVIYNFQGGNDGNNPIAGLIFDQSGILYGATTSDNGLGGGGTIFELSPSGGGWMYSSIYTIPGSYFCGPFASLVMHEAGSLYGTTGCDGAHGQGNVFKLTNTGGSWTYTSLYDFTGGSDGGYPLSNVTFDANGNLYGTTSCGGAGAACPGGAGVVWEITP